MDCFREPTLDKSIAACIHTYLHNLAHSINNRDLLINLSSFQPNPWERNLPSIFLSSFTSTYTSNDVKPPSKPVCNGTKLLPRNFHLV